MFIGFVFTMVDYRTMKPVAGATALLMILTLLSDIQLINCEYLSTLITNYLYLCIIILLKTHFYMDPFANPLI